jgi:outer membrane receptor protein involved in Fe transport
VRANYGRGYKVPTLKDLYEPDSVQTLFFANQQPYDAVTGHYVSGLVQARWGGNPNLKPERSRSINLGVIYEPTVIPNFSISLDYFDIDYTDKVATLQPQDTLDYFPSMVERSPIDQTITLIDQRPVNLAETRAKGYDLKLTYLYQTAAIGSFDFRLNGTYNEENSDRQTPTSTPINNLASGRLARVRANTDVFWRIGRYELGTSATYESATNNYLLYTATAPLRVRQALVFDLQASYDFGAERHERPHGWTDGMKVTVGVLNLLDRAPSPTNGDGGYAKIDPRQRRYYIGLRKTF